MTLVEWAETVRVELGLAESEPLNKEDVERILDLARDAAHSIARPAAPLTTFLLGVAVGRGADPERAARVLSELALSRGGREEGDT
ncbi:MULTISPECIES: DUF6457 domain-containing protein [Nocardiopsis]|uniref:DUF6457 domain-containing protein n=1 Tax=Nocardiopsis lambiniae TaxID=3075539 RepID=A0ABU2M5B7_9ACTN|nr:MULTISPECIES: DUF6457 domain-containing protein [unclassified Nocardiopsis]MDE3719972.1 DUF6457 domain-containing protein [Nocardiopsis sp. N85]MDT0327521.1 DUF6457 domain-containing protein [Nocardiopsis sp. DSM 44743]